MGLRYRYVDYGLANRCGDTIELNSSLKEFPVLLAYCKQHEVRHSKNISAEDLANELRFKFFIVLQLALFCITHKSTWTDVLPIHYRNHEWIYDANQLILYGVLLAVIAGACWFLM